MSDTPASPTPGLPETTSVSKPDKPEYRPKGKIAWLPKPLRDRINHMLLDGVSYVAIVKELAAEVPDLNTVNLCRYHKRGFRIWLREQNLLASTRSRQEDAIEFSRQTNPATLNDAAVQVALVQIYDALHDFQSGDLKQKLASDPAAYARLVNALSRLAKENLSMQKYRDLRAKTEAAVLKRRDPNRELTAAEDTAIIDRMDAFFKKRRPRPPASPAPQSPPSSTTASPAPAPNGSPPAPSPSSAS